MYRSLISEFTAGAYDILGGMLCDIRVQPLGQPFNDLLGSQFATDLSQALLASFFKVRSMPILHGGILLDAKSIANLGLQTGLSEINSPVPTSETVAIVKYSIADIACQKYVQVFTHLLSTVNPGNPYFRLHFWLCMEIGRNGFIRRLEGLTTWTPCRLRPAPHHACLHKGVCAEQESQLTPTNERRIL